MRSPQTYTIDNTTIVRGAEGYYTTEVYTDGTQKWYSIRTYLGRTKREVLDSLIQLNDWNYRAWHGEMYTILSLAEEFATFKMPTIRLKNKKEVRDNNQ